MKNLPRVCLLTAVACILSASVQAQVIVIAYPGVKSTEVSKADLRDVFTGIASNLKDGASVTPVLLKEGNTHDAFLSAYVGKSDSAFRSSWRSLVFSGQASMPKSVTTESALVEYVAHTPGAIGYISSATPHDGVKVLGIH